jgi:hypothetical protein
VPYPRLQSRECVVVLETFCPSQLGSLCYGIEES